MLRKLYYQLKRRQVTRRLRKNGYGDVEIEKMSANGQALEVVLKHPLFFHFADAMAGVFHDVGGVNFAEILWGTSDGRIFTVTIAPRKPGILSPGEVVKKLRRACDLAHTWFETDSPTLEQTEAVRKALSEIQAMYAKE